MSKKGRGRRKSTRPARKSRPPVGVQATAAMDALVQPRKPTRLELVEEPALELAEAARLELVPDAADSAPDAARASGMVAVADPFRGRGAEEEEERRVDPDEISIPPIGDVDAHGDVEAEQFFSDGDLGKHLAESAAEEAIEDEIWSEQQAREARRTRPEVIERRARNERYVKWAVAIGAVVCLAALARAGVSQMGSGVDARTTLAAHAPAAEPAPLAASPAPVAASPAPVAATPNPVATQPAPVAAAAEIAPPVAEPAPAPKEPEIAKPGGEAQPSPVIAPVETARAAAAAPDKPAAPTLSASALKGRARASLESGAAAQAVRFGEQSVAADPSDGEAWLILGAAYQERGNIAQARRCYAACVQKGKRGPLGECRAMLR